MASTSQAVRIFPEPLRSTAFGSITGSYTAVGTALAHPARLVLFQNTTDQAVYISWDGTNDHMYIPAGSFILLDIGTNKGLGSEFCISQNTTFYVKYASAPSSGVIVISVFYGRE
jgi:hypothetical protein